MYRVPPTSTPMISLSESVMMTISVLIISDVLSLFLPYFCGYGWVIYAADVTCLQAVPLGSIGHRMYRELHPANPDRSSM